MRIISSLLFLLLFEQHSSAPLHVPTITPVNQRITSFTYRSLDTKQHSLSELKGKVVVIDFWGTWCAGCVQEMPTIEHLYGHYRNDPKVAFVIVSQNDTLDKIKTFIAKNHFNLPFYYVGTDTVPPPLAPQAWPSTYFVSADGVLRGQYLGGGDWSDPSVVQYIDQLKQKYPAK